jgi:hypothetical protein
MDLIQMCSLCWARLAGLKPLLCCYSLVTSVPRGMAGGEGFEPRSLPLHFLIQILAADSLTARKTRVRYTGGEGFEPKPDVLAPLRATGRVQITLRFEIRLLMSVRRQNHGRRGI